MRRRLRTIALLGLCLVAAVAGATACGGHGDGSANESVSTGNPMKASSYEGLKTSAAIAKAEAANVTWRITREDDEDFMVTLDYDPERVNFEIDDGRVTTASFG